MVGDQPPRLDHRPAVHRRHSRGPASVFRPPRAVAPLREVNDDRPRPGLSPSCRLTTPSSWGLAAFPWRHRRDASNPLLQPTFRVTSTRSETPPLETSRRAPWVTPPAFAFEIRLEQGACPLLGGDAGPPRGHPASSGSVLDGTSPASGRAAPRRAFALRGQSAGAFSAAFTLRRSNPLTPPSQ
jgi:hypothetical protein